MGYTNGCSIPYTLRRNGIYYVYFRFTECRFFRCSLGTDSPRPVSYTHLDVYKRQDIDISGLDPRLKDCVIRVACDAVSYTHLDVYKSQQ